MRGFSLSVCLCVWPFHCNYTSSFWWKKFIWLVKLRLLLSLHPGASGWCGDGGNQNGKQTLNGSSSRGKPCLVRSGVRVCACMYTYKSLAWRVGTMTMTALKTRAGSRGEAAEAGKCWVGFQGCHGFLSHLLPCRRVWWRHPRAIRAGASLHAVPCFTTGSWGAKRTWMCEGLHLSGVVNVNWDARSAPRWWQHGDIRACSMMWLAQAFPHQLCSPLSTAQLINSLYIKV